MTLRDLDDVLPARTLCDLCVSMCDPDDPNPPLPPRPATHEAYVLTSFTTARMCDEHYRVYGRDIT